MKPKKSNPGNIYIPSGVDACQTPDYAIYPLLPYLRDEWVYWEPAMGKGYLLNSLRKRNYKAFGSDITNGLNFFDVVPGFLEFHHCSWDCILTNPPYSIKYQWISHCYDLGKPWMLLMPLETLGAESGQSLFEKYGMELIVFTPRINFEMPIKGDKGSGAQFPTAWFTSGLNIGRQITYCTIPSKLIPGRKK